MPFCGGGPAEAAVVAAALLVSVAAFLVSLAAVLEVSAVAEAPLSVVLAVSLAAFSVPLVAVLEVSVVAALSVSDFDFFEDVLVVEVSVEEEVEDEAWATICPPPSDNVN